MATHILRNPSAVVATGVAGTSVFDRLAIAWSDFRRAQRTRHELEALTDRELADIGLRRGDIENVARQGGRTIR
jgi:uncharacterized protein YjiS (DUF1127 family)